ncbi:MAG: outer membrane protein transport protein [Acidobacteriota bacterium]|nr:outer membrane protein transport protein [Acidobacteriota bacterium]
MKTTLSSLLLFAVLPLWAQNDIQANVNLQFRFTNPGARAQAMGGAFIGVADDTTAIFANPAGLTRMSSRTVILEANTTRRDNPIPFYQGRIQQFGSQDFTFDLESRDFSETVTGIPFFAYVNPKSKVKWGVFYAEQANFDREFETGPIGVVPVFNRPEVDENRLGIFPSSVDSVQLTLRSLGFSAAGNLTPNLSVGATLAFNRMDYETHTTSFLDDPRLVYPEFEFDITPIEPFIGLPVVFADAMGEDDDISFYLGLLYTASDRFHVGLSYKRQGEFDYDYQGSTVDDRFEEQVVQIQGTSTFNVPDAMGLGFSFLPTESTILSFEINRVFYSDLSDDYARLFFNEDDPGNFSQVADDATEYRVGFEYLFLNMAYPLAVRAGYWFEPYHALVNEALDTQIIFRYLDESGDFFQNERSTPFLQRFASDLNHITFGLGMSFGKYTLDASADIDDQNTSFSLSSIYRF